MNKDIYRANSDHSFSEGGGYYPLNKMTNSLFYDHIEYDYASVTFKILEINQEKEKIRLGIKQLVNDPFDSFINKKVSDVITVIVESTSNNGIQVYTGNKNQLILIKKNQLAKEPENARPSRFAKGDKVDALITELDKEKRKIAISIKALEEKQTKEAVKKYGSKDSGGVLGEILGPLLKKNKKKDK